MQAGAGLMYHSPLDFTYLSVRDSLDVVLTRPIALLYGSSYNQRCSLPPLISPLELSYASANESIRRSRLRNCGSLPDLC